MHPMIEQYNLYEASKRRAALAAVADGGAARAWLAQIAKDLGILDRSPTAQEIRDEVVSRLKLQDA